LSSVNFEPNKVGLSLRKSTSKGAEGC